MIGLALATSPAFAATPPAQPAPPALSLTAPIAPPSGLRPVVPVAEQVLTREQAAASVSQVAIDYYTKQFGVSADVARVHLATQLMAPGIGDVLTQKWGDEIAETWFDNASGQWVVAATSSVPAAALADVFADKGLAQNYALDRVSYTHSDLTAAMEALQKRVSDQVAAGVVRVGEGAGKIDVTLAASLKPTPNESPTSSAATARAAVDAAVRSLPADGPAVDQHFASDRSLIASPGRRCVQPNCDTLVGGDRYFSLGGAACTMSWFGSYTITRLNMFMLTAGHCTIGMGENTQVFADSLDGEVQMGFAQLGAYGTGDYGWVALDASGKLNPDNGSPFGGVIDWASNTFRPLVSYFNVGTAPAGLTVCHQGYGMWLNNGSGTSCGQIGSVNASVNVDGTVLRSMMRIDNTFGCHGDSGGPFDLASQETAVGIFSSLTEELQRGSMRKNGVDHARQLAGRGVGQRQLQTLRRMMPAVGAVRIAWSAFSRPRGGGCADRPRPRRRNYSWAASGSATRAPVSVSAAARLAAAISAWRARPGTNRAQIAPAASTAAPTHTACVMPSVNASGVA